MITTIYFIGKYMLSLVSLQISLQFLFSNKLHYHSFRSYPRLHVMKMTSSFVYRQWTHDRRYFTRRTGTKRDVWENPSFHSTTKPFSASICLFEGFEGNYWNKQAWTGLIQVGICFVALEIFIDICDHMHLFACGQWFDYCLL